MLLDVLSVSAPLVLILTLVDGHPSLNFTANDIENHLIITAWTQKTFLAHGSRQQKEVFAAILELGRNAVEMPELALGVAMALYSYFWWEGPESNGLNVQTGLEATRQFHRSIAYSNCDDATLPMEDFAARQCHLRWRHLLMIISEVGIFLSTHMLDLRLAADVLRKATNFMHEVHTLPFFQRYDDFGLLLQKPHDMSFNQDFFPHLPFGPIWQSSEVPLANFLETHYDEFLVDLRNILEADLFTDLHKTNLNAGSHYQEFGPREGDWQTIYFVRSGKWNERNCEAAPRTCELLRDRPEISNCPLGNSGAGFLRLQPAGRIKPHYGNAPRLSVHLGLIAPSTGEIYMAVGGKRVVWEVGKATVFDDTYVHSVLHDGIEPRFVLNAWFCHPCDYENLPPGVHSLPPYCVWHQK